MLFCFSLSSWPASLHKVENVWDKSLGDDSTLSLSQIRWSRFYLNNKPGKYPFGQSLQDDPRGLWMTCRERTEGSTEIWSNNMRLKLPWWLWVFVSNSICVNVSTNSIYLERSRTWKQRVWSGKKILLVLFNVSYHFNVLAEIWWKPKSGKN